MDNDSLEEQIEQVIKKHERIHKIFGWVDIGCLVAVIVIFIVGIVLKICDADEGLRMALALTTLIFPTISGFILVYRLGENSGKLYQLAQIIKLEEVKAKERKNGESRASAAKNPKKNS